MKVIRRTPPRPVKMVVRYVTCCRVWAVDALSPVGRCGRCREVPR